MPVNDSAVLLPGIGHILYSTTGTAAKPALTDLTAFAANTATLPAGFSDLGHTDISNVLTFGQDGGTKAIKGSWQNAALREVITAQSVDFFTVKSIQTLDNEVLTLFYGGGDASVANEFALPDSPTPTEKSICLIMLDGTLPIALYVNKCSILGDGASEWASDDYTKWPLKFTPLKNGSNPKAVWISDSLGI